MEFNCKRIRNYKTGSCLIIAALLINLSGCIANTRTAGADGLAGRDKNAHDYALAALRLPSLQELD